MPAIVSRREFLKIAGLGATVLSVGFPASANAEDRKEFRVALLSDTHIPANPEEEYRGYKPYANFLRITPEVVAMKPELVIIDGDLARIEGKLDDYQALSELLKPIAAVAPICVTMGNHDDRSNFGMVFKSVAGENQKVAGKQVLVLEHEIVRCIALDSLMYVNKVAGQLGKAQRDWLAGYLPKIADRPAVIFVHHSLEANDGDLVDVDRLFEILKPNPHVKAIFYGHSHVWKLHERQGIQLINLPAIGYPFRETDPAGWVEGRFHKNGVELTMRAFGGNRDENGKKFDLKWS